MSVRKRQWRAANGETNTAWVCDYFDQNGKRRNETFAAKGQAVSPSCTSRARHQERHVHVAHDGKQMIADAAQLAHVWKPMAASARRSSNTSNTCACTSCRCLVE